MSLPAWNSNSAYNKYTDTYFKGVVDVSGGNIINRNGDLTLVTGGIIAGSNTITNTVLGYCKGFVSDAQTQITNLAATAGSLVTKTQNINFSGGGTVISNIFSFSGTLNGVLPSTFAYISTLSSSAQSQFNTLTSNLITTNSNVTSLTATVSGHTTNLTNIIYNPISTYTDMFNVYVSSYLISEGTTLKNTTLITGNLSVNSQTVSNTQLGYLSNLSGDVQSAIDSLNTKTTGISAGGGGYTNINFLDVTDYLYSATGSQLDGTTLINGPLSIGTTGSILANSLSISPIVLSYLANVTSDIQAQFNSTSGVTNGAQTWSGIKTFSSPPVLSGASITASSISNSALATSYLQLATAQTCAGIKTFTGNCVFSGNPSFTGTPSFVAGSISDGALASTFVKTTGAVTIAGVKTFSSAPIMSGASITSGTIPIASLASSTFTTTLNAPNILIDNTAYTGFYSMNSGVSTVNSLTIKARSSTSSYNNPSTQSGDVEISSSNNATAGSNGLNLCMGSTVSGGIRITESNIAFNSPITITGNITSNSQTITPAQLGFVSGASANLQNQISSHTTSITALQSATTYITTSSSNEVQMNAPIKLYSPTLQPSGNQLGTYQQSWYTGSGNISTATQNICSITLSPGTYLMTILYDIYHTTGGASEQVTASVSTTSATHAVAQSGRGPYNQFYPGLTSAKESQQYTMWVSNASGSNTTYYFVITLSTAAVMTNQSFMDATRIA